jgi:hypothetical protein
MNNKGALDKYFISEDHSDDKFSLKEISPGLYSSEPQLLHINNNKAYANLVAIPDVGDNIYSIYFTQKPGEIQLKNKYNVIGSVLMEDYKHCNKYLIHKLRRYKKIIDEDRYFVTDNPNEFLDKIKQVVKLFEKEKENKMKSYSLYY